MLSPTELIAKAEAHKEAGNLTFKQQDWGSAMQDYHFGLLALKSLGEHGMATMLAQDPNLQGREKLTQEQKLQLLTLTKSLRLNISMVLLKQLSKLPADDSTRERKVQRVVEECTAVLKEDKDNVKALFRRASAHFLNKRYDLAQPDIVAANILEPTNKAVLSKLAILKKWEASQGKKQAKVYQNMFK
eukprot:TRINITY_DN10792_c0_g1_i1.p1 TRINITY_DN10792_c0_g1~~TRINITY_DN10792_c0_g1_i1.p1  ORF type:complete len:188 (+),score=46.36 TRINITY_DN10792_c0_g1_i1:54-617(+)